LVEIYKRRNVCQFLHQEEDGNQLSILSKRNLLDNASWKVLKELSKDRYLAAACAGIVYYKKPLLSAPWNALRAFEMVHAEGLLKKAVTWMKPDHVFGTKFTIGRLRWAGKKNYWKSFPH
jgi:hypothetical protein